MQPCLGWSARPDEDKLWLQILTPGSLSIECPVDTILMPINLPGDSWFFPEGLGKVVLRTWGSPGPSLRKHRFLRAYHLPFSWPGLICLPTQPAQNGPRVQTGSYGAIGERLRLGLEWTLLYPVLACGCTCNA